MTFRFYPKRRQRGATLIELMIALLLGLLVVAAAGGLFLTNKRIYASTETLNRIQENSRVSFELMARDIREAGGNPCGQSSRVINQLNSRNSVWWSNFNNGLRGLRGDLNDSGLPFGSNAGDRVSGTEALDLHLVDGLENAVIRHASPEAPLEMASVDGLATNDIAMACNTAFSLIFQVSGVAGTDLHHEAGGAAPGNCAADFSWQQPPNAGDCSAEASVSSYCVLVPEAEVAGASGCGMISSEPAMVVPVRTARWYIGNNSRGGTSLYRATLTNNSDAGGTQVLAREEIAEGVSGLSMEYRVSGGGNWRAVTAVNAGDWPNVDAVRVRFVTEAAEGALEGGYLEGTDGERLRRTTTHVVAIRNRESVL